MLKAFASVLEQAGLSVDVIQREATSDVDAGIDGAISVSAGGGREIFAVEVKERIPGPSQLVQLRELHRRLADVGRPLFATKFVSERAAERLEAEGWSWVDLAGNMELRGAGLLVSRRIAASAPPGPPPRGLPGGIGGASLVRLLINWEYPSDAPLPTTVDLAERIGVSQPRVSQILGRLAAGGYLVKRAREWFVTDRRALLDAYLAERIEPPRPTTYLYTLASLNRFVEQAHAEMTELVWSADIGVDLVAPWKQPEAVVVYATGIVNWSRLGVVEAESPGAANVHLVHADHVSEVCSWPPLVASLRSDGPELRIADPVLMLHDLESLGGGDREDAASVLRDWILARP